MMRWLNEEARLVYENLVAMGNAVIEEANRKLSGDPGAPTLLGLPSLRHADRIIVEALQTANAYFNEAAKIAAAFSMPKPIILDAKTLQNPAA